jgi:hypothetical protein
MSQVFLGVFCEAVDSWQEDNPFARTSFRFVVQRQRGLPFVSPVRGRCYRIAATGLAGTVLPFE